MDTGYVMEVFRQSVILVMQLAGPILLASVTIGLVVAIFQAATQALTFQTTHALSIKTVPSEMTGQC